MARHALSFSDLSSDAVQLVLGSAEAQAGVRLASCSRFLRSEAKRCQALWDHALAQGERHPRDYRVLAAAVKALTAEEAPALEAGSELLGRVGAAAVRTALHGELHETYRARWEAGLEAAEAFKEVPEAQVRQLDWLWVQYRFLDHLEDDSKQRRI